MLECRQQDFQGHELLLFHVGLCHMHFWSTVTPKTCGMKFSFLCGLEPEILDPAGRGPDFCTFSAERFKKSATSERLHALP